MVDSAIQLFKITNPFLHADWSRAMFNKSEDHGNDVMVAQFVFLFLACVRFSEKHQWNCTSKLSTGFANFIDKWSHCDFCFTNFGVILKYLESSITTKKAIFRLSSTWSWHVYTIVIILMI